MSTDDSTVPNRLRTNKETATDILFGATLPTSILAASSRQRDEGESLSTIAYRRIREMIVRLQLPPASVIDESLLAEELDIGLTPIRQALRRLALENLVVILPRRGTLIADLNMSDLQKIFEMRLELEALAARLAADRATAKQIHDMEALLDTDNVEAGKVEGEKESLVSHNERLIQIDRAAHLLLAEAAHNEFLWETLDWLYVHVLRLWYVSFDRVTSLDKALAEHRQIVAAVKERDRDRAEALMREHVASFQNEVLTKA